MKKLNITLEDKLLTHRSDPVPCGRQKQFPTSGKLRPLKMLRASLLLAVAGLLAIFGTGRNPRRKLGFPSFITFNCGAFRLGAKARTSFSPIIWVPLCLTLAFTQTGYPMPINVLETQYTTGVSLWGNGGLGIGSTNTSPVPISGSLNDPIYGGLAAQANAGPFESLALAWAAAGSGGVYNPWPIYWGAGASATSDIWFSPLSNQTTTINIQFASWYDFSVSCSVSLLDVTSGNQMWNYRWNSSGGTIQWVSTGGTPNRIATLTLNTDFDPSHIYELTMYTEADSNVPDVEQISIQLSGLEPVPEPSTFALVSLGAVAWLTLHRRCYAFARNARRTTMQSKRSTLA
jgi:hypothetical protein